MYIKGSLPTGVNWLHNILRARLLAAQMVCFILHELQITSGGAVCVKNPHWVAVNAVLGNLQQLPNVLARKVLLQTGVRVRKPRAT